MNVYSEEVVSEKVGSIGFITLNRPKALNALSLHTVRELTHRATPADAAYAGPGRRRHRRFRA